MFVRTDACAMRAIRSPLSLAITLAFATSAYAADGADADASGQKSARNLDRVEVHGQRDKGQSSPKATATLLDTPQTVTVVTKQSMDQQGLLGLRDVLSTLPGITFGAGEGGGGYGDKINLRGFDATSDITVDGVRDSGLYSRTDNFNLESIELVNGANSVYSGAGAVGGSINLVTKAAQAGNRHDFTLGAGTDGYGRVTADSNIDLDNGRALRLNAMGHAEDVPGRDHEFRHRWGFAPSMAFGLGGDTRFTLSYMHQQDNNLPQYGVPYARNAINAGPLPGIDRETYFGYRNTSRQQTRVDMLSGVFEHDFSDAVKLRSLLRAQRADQHSNTTALQGSWCFGNGTDPFTGAACAMLADGTRQPAGTWSPTGGPRGLVRDTRNTMLHNQNDLSLQFNTGAIAHQAVVGLSLSRETYTLDTGSIFRDANGLPLPNTNAHYPLQSFDNPHNIWTGPINYVRSGHTEARIDNRALYAFDTLKLNEQWLLNLGARYENNQGSTTNYTVDAMGNITGIASGNPFASDENLFSWRAGAIYKPAKNASLYLSYANSRTPSKASVNASCNVATCNVDPESASNIELGGKWDVLDAHLSLTAAVFRNQRDSFKVVDTLNPTGEQVLDGKARVDGVALGAAGHINRHWSVFANYTWLDSEVLQSVSDAVRQGTGIDAQAGDPLPNTPRHSGSIWTTYEAGKWTFGYGANYQGSFHPTSANADAGIRTPAYWVQSAMLGYEVNEQLSLQLNVKNLADTEYYTSIRNNATNGWAIPGDGRSATLTARFGF